MIETGSTTMDKMQTETLPPTIDDVDIEPGLSPTLALAVAGMIEIQGTGSDDSPPLLMLFMADGTVRWVSQPSED
tara:strand:+ start:447 stop:671 length:225 start_codon:yes stop_codon:yes gene_type:complete